MNRRPMFLLICLSLLLAPRPGSAQNAIALQKYGALTATNANCTSTACVQIPISPQAGTVGIQITGTFSGTITFEVSIDGATWVAAAAAVTAATEARVVSATAPGLWQMNVAGYTAMRARCSTYSSGTINVTLNRSAATSGNGS